MGTVLFVHGTGVRRGSYLATLACIRRAFDDHAIDHTLDTCLWGDDLGAGEVRKAVPDVTLDPHPAAALTRDQAYARWDLLARDPLFELRLLRNKPASGPKPPAAVAAAKALWNRIEVYVPTATLVPMLERAGLTHYWDAAWKRVVVDDETARLATQSSTEIGEPGQAVARALMAEMMGLAFEDGAPVPDAQLRDALVDRLVDDWQARVAGVGAYLLRFVGEMAASIATPIIKWRRGPLAESANPAAGDILRYQARGAPIREYIRKRIDETPGDVYLLAHSLGGIACVDLLAAAPLDRVKGLITVGSQASYLHEIGALYGVEPGTPTVPDYFPRWLNLYDPYDFLSYVAAPVFGERAQDVRIESGQPFPQSHSAYWTNAATWAAIREFVA
jgi:hypothetical protein